MADTEDLPAQDAAASGSGLGDPRARWRTLPDRIPPEQWVTEKADPAVPGSVRAAEEQRETHEAWNDIRWGFG